MSEHIEEDSRRVRENVIDNLKEQPDAIMTLDETMDTVLNKASSGCSLPEIKLNKIVFNTVCDQIRYVTRISELLTDIAALPEELTMMPR